MATWQHLRSSTANKRPTTSLADGRIAINTNTASPGLFFKDSAGTGIVKVGPVHVGTTAPNSVPAAGGSSGNYTGEQWLDTSVSPAQMKVWNGSTWVGIVADELPVSKLQDGAARQLIQTDAAGTGVEWTSNVDVPGTLDVTSTATFDSIAQYPLGSAGAPTITFTGDNNTGIYSPGADQVAISTNGTGRLFVNATGEILADTSTSVDGNWKIQANAAAGALTGIGVNNNGGYGVYLIYDNSTRYSGAGVLRNIANSPLAFETNNTERLRITSAGLVGVGTSSPSTLVEGRITGVGGTPATSGTSQPNAVFRVAGSGTTGVLDIGCNSGAPWIQATDRTDLSQKYSLLLNPNGGSVGIGTTSPNATLVVSASSTAGMEVTPGSASASSGTLIEHYNRNTAAYIQVRTIALEHVFSYGSGEAARIDSSGRLLVGTSSARQGFFNGVLQSPHLEIEGLGLWESSAAYINNENSTGGHGLVLARSRGTSKGSFTIVQNNDVVGGIYYQGADGTDFVDAARITCEVDGTPGANDMPCRLVFSTTADGASSPTERMRITSNGNVLINSDPATSARFAITGYASGDRVGIFMKPSGNNAVAIVFTNASGGLVGSIATDASATLYNTSSDYRLKENVTPVTDGITRLQQLKPSRFNFIANPGKTVDGFLAHEVQAIVPEAITGEKDAVDDEGNPQYQGIDQSKMVPLVVAALQECIKKVEALELELALLKSKP